LIPEHSDCTEGQVIWFFLHNVAYAASASRRQDSDIDWHCGVCLHPLLTLYRRRCHFERLQNQWCRLPSL
jgi:hypothetical protein